MEAHHQIGSAELGGVAKRMKRWYDLRFKFRREIRWINNTCFEYDRVVVPSEQAMSAQTRSQRDKEMAAYLKKIGHERTSARCPVCNSIVGLNTFQSHIASHK